MTSFEQQIADKKRNEKKEMILNHQVEGEAFITSNSRTWKIIVLEHFNKIQRGEITLEQMLDVMKKRGVIFSQKDSLVQYPVKECLYFIAKVSNKELILK